MVYAVQYLTDSMTEGDLLAGHTVAFTGEVGQATGTVWAVGGIAEKLSAAQASGVEIVFIPQENATAGFHRCHSSTEYRSSLSRMLQMRLTPYCQFILQTMRYVVRKVDVPMKHCRTILMSNVKVDARFAVMLKITHEYWTDRGKRPPLSLSRARYP